ncbi:SDR family oxidoreductase [Pontixanthobacter aquaemixtae]|uniref:SDR family NAD(P)-dependent oxidoreductase n=1 Tax=Pontixanthobacter aquaemixtae TaxID=1958940 RepID=A0A844ZS79_9SPHN|nr:SDR family oxidoreductase [Pontixanthobacter aquaemixtae]MXO89970.1 SDR family NAD(P)-dependent oxidoreductase [Pontixanthobacter aquaemixtae]
MTKTIAITGGGEGLGRVLARRFAADGDRVILLGRTFAKVEAVAEELGEPHFAVQCDVTDPDSVRSAFKTIGEKCDRLDVLVNNAASYEPFELSDVTDSQLAATINTNLAGPILCAREALPLLQGGGHVVNVSSESVRLKFAMQWLYTATKAALEVCSEMWTRELEPQGVRSTVVQCGQMFDESKTGSTWPMEVAIKFMEENMKVGIDVRNRPLSHFKSVAEVFRAVIDTPPDVHLGIVTISGNRPSDGQTKGNS